MNYDFKTNKDISGFNDKFIKDHISLIKSISFKYRKYYHSDYENLICFGIEGLYEAYLAFDESQGVPFNTFAYRYIDNSIKNEVNNQNEIVSVSENNRKDLILINKYKKEFYIIYDREPSVSEIIDYMNKEGSKKQYTSQDISSLLSSRFCSSFNQQIGEDLVLEDVIEDEGEDPRKEFESIERKNRIKKVCSILNEEEYFIVSHTFGVNSMDEMTETEMSEVLHKDREYIRNVFNRSCERMRNLNY